VAPRRSVTIFPRNNGLGVHHGLVPRVRGGATPLSMGVSVRREVAQIFVNTQRKTVAVVEFTCCSASSILPPRAPCKNGGVRSVRDNVTPDQMVKRLTRERRSILSASQGGGEPGWKDRVNRCELPINVVTMNRRQRPTRLTQKGCGQVRGLLTPPTQMLGHRRKGSTYVLREGFVRNTGSPYFSLNETGAGNAIRKESRWECG